MGWAPVMGADVYLHLQPFAGVSRAPPRGAGDITLGRVRVAAVFPLSRSAFPEAVLVGAVQTGRDEFLGSCHGFM